MPILGVVASSISGHLTPPYSTDYYSIATYTVSGGSTTSFSFNSIPQTYKHLQLRCSWQNSYFSLQQNERAFFLTFNGDGGNNYTFHQLYAYGDGTIGSNSTTPTAYVASNTTINSDANTFGVSIIDILDYTNTNKNKTCKVFGGISNNGVNSGSNDVMQLRSGLWVNTSAISSINIAVQTTSSTTFLANSQFALYGIKG